MTQAFNMDCMDAMRGSPDKFFDLAVVDPPYGISITDSGRLKRYNKSGRWDDKPPTHEYFDELFRVSKGQIIWGGQLLCPPADKVLFDLG